MHDVSIRVPLIIYDPQLPSFRTGRVMDEFALNIDIPVADGRLAMGFTPYELKTVLLRIPGVEVKRLTQPVELEFDTDVFSLHKRAVDIVEQVACR